MSLQVEKLEHSMAKLTIEASADDFEKACQSAYQKEKGRISVPGFRKGKAPRKLIEKMYGEGIFYESAANSLINETYRKEIEEHDELDVVSRPDIEVTQAEKGKPFIFTALVALKPPVELGKYKGISCTKRDTSVADEEIDEKIDEERARDSRIVTVTDRAVKEKDIAVIDFEGFKDGVPFDGGKGEDYELTIGSHTFIDTFEDQLIGHKTGEDLEVNVTFPENYNEKSLAGQPALFKVTIKEIREKQLPEVDEDYVSDKGFDSIEDYRKDISDKIKKRKEDEARAAKEDELIQAIIDDSKMDIPEAMLETETDMLLEDYQRRISYQGISFEQYLQYIGMTVDRLRTQLSEQAKKNIESRLVLEAVADAEKIEVSDEEVEEEVKKIASNYGLEPEKMKDIMGDKERKNIVHDRALQKAVDMIIDSAKETKKPKDDKKKS